VAHIDYYELLQVDPRASDEVIHKAYRVLAARYHPDAAGRGDESRMRLLNEAYYVLSDPARRAQYDRRRAIGLVQLFYEEGLVGLTRRWLRHEGLGR